MSACCFSNEAGNMLKYFEAHWKNMLNLNPLYSGCAGEMMGKWRDVSLILVRNLPPGFCISGLQYHYRS